MTDTTSLPEEFVLLQRELIRLTDRRFARGKVFPLAGVLCLAVLSLMCGYRSLSAIPGLGIPIRSVAPVETTTQSVGAHIVPIAAHGVGGGIASGLDAVRAGVCGAAVLHRESGGHGW